MPRSMAASFDLWMKSRMTPMTPFASHDTEWPARMSSASLVMFEMMLAAPEIVESSVEPSS